MNEEKPRQPGAKNHKSGCFCGMCARIRENEKIASEKEQHGKKARRRPLVGHRRFVQEFVNPDSPGYKCASQAAALAGYSQAHADSAGATLLKNSQVQKLILAAMQKAGIDEGYLAGKIRDGLEATQKWRNVVRETGEVIERSDPDHYARHKFLETALRTRGDLRDEQGPVAALILRLPMVGSAPDVEAELNTYFSERAKREAIDVVPSAA